MGLSPCVSLVALVACLLLSVLVYVRTWISAGFPISYGQLGPTEARRLAVLLNAAMFVFGERFVRVGLVGWDPGR